MKVAVSCLYGDYGRYITRYRAFPNSIDLLLLSQRRTLLSLFAVARHKHVKSAKVIGHCFIKDSLVATTNGLIPIQKIQIGDEIFTQNGTNIVTNTFMSSNKDDLIKIKLENGMENICTKDQKIKVMDINNNYIWKGVSDLNNNDYIVLRQARPKLRNYVVSDNLTIDEDIGYIVGHFIGDGSIDHSTGSISFSSEVDILKKLQQIIKTKFGKTYKIQKTQSTYRLRMHTPSITKPLISKLGLSGKKSITVSIPDIILCSPSSVVFAFLSGLIDANGHISRLEDKKNNITIATSSKVLSTQLQTLLFYHGVHSIINSQNVSDRESIYNGNTVKPNTDEMYYIVINRTQFEPIAKYINLASNYKNSRLNILINNKKQSRSPSKYEVIPYLSSRLFADVRSKHIGGGWYKDAQSGEKIRSGMKYDNKSRYQFLPSKNTRVYSSTFNTQMFEFLEKIESPYHSSIKQIITNNLQFIKVKEISAIPFEETYDIEVDCSHEFICNNMVVHNCIAELHPHGDGSVYGTLQRLVHLGFANGEGNWGSKGLKDDDAAAYRYCVTANTRIPTSEGLLKISDLKPDKGETISTHICSYNKSKNKATKFFDSGKHSIIEIKTKYGYTLSGSQNHPILILSPNMKPQWKTLSEIKINDIAVLKTNSINPSSKLSVEEARLLGMLISEGWYTNNYPRIGINNTDASFIDEFENCLNFIFPGNNISRYKTVLKSEKLLESFNIDKSHMISKIEKLGFTKGFSRSRCIPESIWKDSLESQVEFLRFLFAGDGSVSLGPKSTIFINYCSSSKQLLCDIHQLLLINFGIISTIKSKADRLIIQGIKNCEIFYNKIGFFGHKNEKLKLYLEELESKPTRSKSEFIPFLKNYIIHKYDNVLKQSSVNQFIRKHTWTTKTTLQQNKPLLFSFLDDSDKQMIDFILDQDYIFLEISEKNELKEKQPVYSIKVDSECHSFIGNGFINHNTEVKLADGMADFAFKYLDYVDWNNFEYGNEPMALPCPLPLGLIGNTITAGIAFHRSLIPQYAMKDLATRLKWLLETNSKQDQLEAIRSSKNVMISTNDDGIVDPALGPLIKPVVDGCTVKQNLDYEYYNILINGCGSIRAIPNGSVTKTKINILGRAPENTFNRLQKACDIDEKTKKRHLELRLVDRSKDSINIELTPIKKNGAQHLSQLANTIWKKYLVKNYNISILTYTDNLYNSVIQIGVDQVLLNCFSYWYAARFRKRIQDCDKAIQKRNDSEIILMIREIIKKYECKTITDIINVYLQSLTNKQYKMINSEQFDNTSNQWIIVPIPITEDLIKSICSKRTIRSLIEVEIDLNKLSTEINNLKTRVTNTGTDCYNDIVTLTN